MLFILLLCPGSRVCNLLLKFLRSGIEMLPHRLGDLFGQPTRTLFDGLQLLCYLLPESLERLTDFLFDQRLG